ncbi:MAG: hypothetical protein IPF52_16925 [Saprospiraceae bacterium]|nr:hypothetical protein [Saprospiraceae bacterium]
MFLRYDQKNTGISTSTSKYKGLPGAISLAYDYYGNVWVGSREGLFVYNIKKDVLAPIYPGLINGFVLALKKLPNDKMFVATNNEAFIIDLAGRIQKNTGSKYLTI